MAIDPTGRPGYIRGRCGAWCNRGAPFADWFPCGRYPMANGRCALHGGRGYLRAGWNKGRIDNGRLGKKNKPKPPPPPTITATFNFEAKRRDRRGPKPKRLRGGRRTMDKWAPRFPWHWLPHMELQP